VTLLTCHKTCRIHGIWLWLSAATVMSIQTLSTAALCLVKLSKQVKPKETKIHDQIIAYKGNEEIAISIH
jgi:hypothetical protein